MQIWIVLLLIVGSAVGSFFIYLALRKQGDQLDALKKLAIDSGWTFTHEPAALNKRSTTSLADTKQAWTLKITTSGGGGGSVNRQVEWHTPNHALASGAAVLGPPLPKKTVAMLNGPIPGVAAQIIKNLMFQYIDSLGDVAQNMKMDEGTAGDPQGVVIATPGQEAALDGLRDNQQLKVARLDRNEMLQPIVIRDETGLRVRVRGHFKQHEDLVSFVQLGLTLRDDLSS